MAELARQFPSSFPVYSSSRSLVARKHTRGHGSTPSHSLRADATGDTQVQVVANRAFAPLKSTINHPRRARSSDGDRVRDSKRTRPLNREDGPMNKKRIAAAVAV